MEELALPDLNMDGLVTGVRGYGVPPLVSCPFTCNPHPYSMEDAAA